MLIEISADFLLTLFTVLIHYEALRLASISLPRLTIPARSRIVVVIGIALIAHMTEITLYAGVFYYLAKYADLGTIGGQPVETFYDYLYYSLTTYTTLGIGDYYPLGGLRILTGTESLVGLVMITWSASFTYLAMEKFWGLHSYRDNLVDLCNGSTTNYCFYHRRINALLIHHFR